MIIGIDIRVLGGAKNKSGIEEYTESLLAELLPLDSSIKYKLFFSSYKNNLPDYEWLRLPNVELKKFKMPNRIIFGMSRLFNLPKIDKLMGDTDVFFSPHFFLAPLSVTCKRVSTFHDLSYMHFPEFFSLKQNLWHRMEMAPLKQSLFSDKIIAVSESTKNDLVKMYGIDPEKITVVYSGINKNIFRPSEIELKKFAEEKNIPPRFILYMGKLEPRKNIVGIIKAYNRLRTFGNKYNDLKLIISGSSGWLFNDIFKEAKSSPFSKDIIFTGYIKDEERAYYYSLASILVYPSFFEGFGFPPVESMACGTPVVASDKSSLPEVVGKAGILVNPYSINEICEGIDSILSSESLRGKLIEAGKERIKMFNWKDAATRTLEVLTYK